MWCQKSVEEMQFNKVVKRKRDWRGAIVFWVLASAFVTATRPPKRFGAIWYGMHFPGQGSVPGWIVGPLVVAGIATVWLLSRYRNERRVITLVCPKCQSVKASDNHLECKCGGKFVDLRSVKWVND